MTGFALAASMSDSSSLRVSVRYSTLTDWPPPADGGPDDHSRGIVDRTLRAIPASNRRIPASPAANSHAGDRRRTAASRRPRTGWDRPPAPATQAAALRQRGRRRRATACVCAGLMGKRPAARCCVVQLSRKVAIQVGKPRSRALRRRGISDGRVGERQSVPRGRDIGSEGHGLGVGTDGCVGTIELLHGLAAKAQRLGVARIRRRPALGEFDQLGPSAFGGKRRGAHEIRQGRGVALPERHGVGQRMDVGPLTFRGQSGRGSSAPATSNSCRSIPACET